MGKFVSVLKFGGCAFRTWNSINFPNLTSKTKLVNNILFIIFSLFILNKFIFIMRIFFVIFLINRIICLINVKIPWNLNFHLKFHLVYIFSVAIMTFILPYRQLMHRARLFSRCSFLLASHTHTRYVTQKPYFVVQSKALRPFAKVRSFSFAYLSALWAAKFPMQSNRIFVSEFWSIRGSEPRAQV